MTQSKRVFFIVLAFLYLCLSGCADLFVNESSPSSKGAFEVKDGVITAYYGLENNIVIPREYDGAIINQIGEEAFFGNINIVSIIVPNTITSIGDSAFYNCSSLEAVEFASDIQLDYLGDSAFKNCEKLVSINLPNTIEKIEKYTFDGCTSLESIIIPNSVREIDDYSFYGCSSLNSIQIGNRVNRIGLGSFAKCQSLETIDIPKSVIEIDSYAFSGCSNLEIISLTCNVDYVGINTFELCNSLTIYCEIDEMSCNWPYGWNPDFRPVYWSCIESFKYLDFKFAVQSDAAILEKYLGNETNIDIPSSIVYKDKTLPVIGIGDKAFIGCSFIVSIIIPDSIVSIGVDSFKNCSSLVSVIIPNFVYEIGKRAFYNCSSLQSINFPSESELIEDETFYNCSSLESITISGDLYAVWERAFYNCSSLTSFTTGERLLIIKEEAFYNCSSLETIQIPSSVDMVEADAFKGCSSLVIYCSAPSLPSTWDAHWNSDYRTVYWSCDGYYEENGLSYYLNPNGTANLEKYTEIDEEIVILGTIFYNNKEYKTMINRRVFLENSTITKVEITDGLTAIGDLAFYKCVNLTSINIPNTVTTIGENAFEYCSSLTSIIIPSCVSKIGYRAFSSCSSLTIYCGAVQRPSGWDSSWNPGYATTYWGSDGYVIEDNLDYVLFSDGTAKLRNYLGEEIGEPVTIPSSITYLGKEYIVTTIMKECFSGYTITSVEMPNTITDIEYMAFYNCSNLQTISISKNLITIGDSAFYNCKELVDIEIPNTVKSIGQYAFRNCSSIKTIYIPSSVNKIDYYTFSGCSSLTIYCAAEQRPSNWDSSWNPSGRTVYWGSDGNTILSNFDYVLFSNGTAKLRKYLGEESDASIIIPSSITYLNKDYSVISIMNNCFSGSLISSVEIPDTIIEIGNSAFKNCTHLEIVYNSENLVTIGDSAFNNCKYLTHIEIPNTVTSIGQYAFGYCSSIKSLFIPFSVKKIDYYAFSGCSSLTMYCYAENRPSGWDSSWNPSYATTYWGSEGYILENDYDYILFKNGTTKLRGYSGTNSVVTIPNTISYNSKIYNVISIMSKCFYQNDNLTSISLPLATQEIGSSAFYQCHNLESIEIPNGITSINESTFAYCSSLSSIIIPSSVTSIGTYAFYYCSSLTTITFDGTSSEWNAISKGSYWKNNSAIKYVQCFDKTISV